MFREGQGGVLNIKNPAQAGFWLTNIIAQLEFLQNLFRGSHVCDSRMCQYPLHDLGDGSIGIKTQESSFKKHGSPFQKAVQRDRSEDSQPLHLFET